MLEMRNVWLNIDDDNGEHKEVLKGINLTLEEGKLYAITGPNGGGKTSIAKVIMGIYPVSSGQVFLDGEDITGLSITERARKGLAYAFQQPPRFKGIYVEDLMSIAQPGISPMDMRAYMRDVGLCPEDYIGRDVGPGLSGGEIKRIEVAQLLAREARISIFDEPESGVDLWTIQKLMAIIINKHRATPDNTTVVISHNEQFLPMCDEIIVIADGEVRAQGTAESVWPEISGDIVCRMREQCGGVTDGTQQIR